MSIDKTLYEHSPHPHRPHNVNELHLFEQQIAGFNATIAVTLTKYVGTMYTAYLFAVFAFVGLVAILGWLPPIVTLLVAWVSQTFIQLCLLPIIMVGQNVLGRKSEIQADEQFNTTQKSYHDLGEIMKHLDAQDAELLAQTKILIALQGKALGER